MTLEDASPLEFPCQYPIKAMGRADDKIEQIVWNIVTRHAPDTPKEAVRLRPSRNGQFLSITVSIIATDRAQLDAVYGELQAHPAILAAL